jgi:hypothetical protein
MDKLSKNQIQLNKANRIINEHMPDLAKRFFNDKKNDLMASSIYMYSLDICEFFEYLGTTSFNISKMKLSDLRGITPEIFQPL